MTANEVQHLKTISTKLTATRNVLNSSSLSIDSDLGDWLIFLQKLKQIAGNTHNDMNTIACLMAKNYLYKNLNMREYDAMAKAHGAHGLDIDEFTVEGDRVIAEIKTTSAFGLKTIRGPQSNNMHKDLKRLNACIAKHKFFFVVDPEVFEILKDKYKQQFSIITLVLLPLGEEYLSD